MSSEGKMHPEFRQAKWRTPLLFERLDRDAQDRYTPTTPAPTGGGANLAPAGLARSKPIGLPTIGATDVTRHYTRLSQKNIGVDTSFYPLGSCTMKLNPKVNDEIAMSPESTDMHPLLGDALSQGSLQVIWELQEVLKDVSGMDAVTLQPAAGAQGEWVAMLMTRAYFEARGETRTEVIVPDNAHGTNPASAAMVGFKVVEIPSNAEGGVDLEALEAALSPKTAAFMITNPSTLGIFEANIEKISKMVHAVGAQLYYDGANLNAIMGVTKPGVMGFDMVHFNLHKTLTIPHGGGGPGAGPVGVKAHLAPFLPVPVVDREGTHFVARYDRPQSVGKVKAFHGNFVGYIRSLVYARMMGAEGLTAASHRAVLNANYMKHRLDQTRLFDLPYGHGSRMHEFVLSATKLKKERGIRAADIGKRLLDYGYHAPTVYFPLIVDEAIMIEPTESESKETLDRFIEAMITIAAEDPAVVQSAPHNTSVGRLDEVKAAREPRLTYDMRPKGTTAPST
ncbi:MAG: aminomethyl-transferring glycine dehydrogenase subunit GcvPB [Thermoplasmatota archaeon]